LDDCLALRAPYEDRKGRLKVHSAKLNNTDGNARNDYFKIQTANLLLRRFGVQLIANDRMFHIWEEWPGMDRRLISGSVCDKRAPRSSAAWEGVIRCAHENWKSAERQLAAWRGMQFFHKGGMGAAWLDDGQAGDALRHLNRGGACNTAPGSNPLPPEVPMANGYSIPIIVTDLTPQQRADILLATSASAITQAGNIAVE
jgi:hypothetical protein